jgi:Lantibiotic biosynthesis dehydratase C-term
MSPITNSWIELRVHASTRHLDRILLAGIQPFLERASQRGALQGSYFLRDAETEPGGIRLRLKAAAEETQSLREELEAALRRNQLDGLVDRVEGDATARFSEYEELLQGDAASPLVEDFFTETTPFVFDVLAQIGEVDAARMQAAMDLMIVHPAVVNQYIFPEVRDLPYPNTFLSFRSHVDGFFIMSRDPEAARKALDVRYQSYAVSLRARLELLLAQVRDGGEIVSQPANRWAVFVATYIKRVLEELSSGKLRIQSAADGYIGDNYDLSTSGFHQAIQHSAGFQDFMKTNPEFLALRVMISFLYWTLQRLGIRLVQRYLLCYSVSRGFEETFNVDSTAVMATIATRIGAIS